MGETPARSSCQKVVGHVAELSLVMAADVSPITRHRACMVIHDLAESLMHPPKSTHIATAPPKRQYVRAQVLLLYCYRRSDPWFAYMHPALGCYLHCLDMKGLTGAEHWHSVAQTEMDSFFSLITPASNQGSCRELVCCPRHIVLCSVFLQWVLGLRATW